MPLAKINGRILMFVHIPKTGGSSLEEYMSQKGQLAFLQSRPSFGIKVTAQHFHREMYETLIQCSYYDYGFAVVRDPIERMISEYRYRAKSPSRKQKMKKLYFFGDRADVKLGNRSELLSFDEWVVKILKEYQSDSFIHDNHIRPQAEFVHPNHQIFRFEAGLDMVFRWIDKVTDTTAVTFTKHEKAATWPKPRIKESTLSLLKEFYADDFAIIEGLRAGDEHNATEQGT